MPLKRSAKQQNLTVHNRPPTPLVPRHQLTAPMAQTSQETPGSEHSVGLFWRCLFSRRRRAIPKLGWVQPPTPTADEDTTVTAQPVDTKAKVVTTTSTVRAAPGADLDDEERSRGCCLF